MIYNKTDVGKVFQCTSCNRIHLEFNNLNINFKDKENYYEFVDFIHQLDGAKIEEQNNGSPYSRKIFIPIGSGGCNFLLNSYELENLKQLCIRILEPPTVRLSKLVMEYGLN